MTCAKISHIHSHFCWYERTPYNTAQQQRNANGKTWEPFIYLDYLNIQKSIPSCKGPSMPTNTHTICVESLPTGDNISSRKQHPLPHSHTERRKYKAQKKHYKFAMSAFGFNECDILKLVKLSVFFWLGLVWFGSTSWLFSLFVPLSKQNWFLFHSSGWFGGDVSCSSFNILWWLQIGSRQVEHRERIEMRQTIDFNFW